MPDATITSTASTFGTISGVFSADQSTISGTISGIVPGTLTGSVGVPGPAGPGVPAGGTAGQYLQKIDGTDYNTDWTTVNLSVYAVKSNNLSDLTSASTARTNLGLGTMATATAADYSTTTVANGLYYPLSTNPAGYLTSASLTGYATESWVTAGFYPLTGNPSGFITSSALTPYLTSATAASTYQTLSGMSSYLTTSTAASTYATKASPTFTGLSVFNNPGNYAISIDNSAGYYTSISSGVYSIVNAAVEVIRLSGSGIKYPDGLTQSVAYPGSTDFLLKADNLSGLANTGTARTNLGLGTMAVETASNYLTTATASSTYFTIASAANKADLASPTFSGTPTLPTGTIGVTQSPGNNTTALATTAFVTAATPAASTTVAGLLELATRLEVVEPSSSTLAVSPMRALDVLMNPGYVQIAQNTNNVAVTTSGTGASSFTTSMTRVCIGPNVSVAGFAYYRPQTNGGVGQFFAKGINNASINFSKPFWMSGRSLYDDTFRGDANNTSRITVGKSATGAGALAQKGIGWQKVGGLGSNFFLLAHNGTTLTSVDTTTSLTSLGITGGVPFDWSVYSDGAGNVTMFINNVQVATTSAGPTGYSTGSSVWQEEIDQTASAATRMYFTTFGGHYYHA